MKEFEGSVIFVSFPSERRVKSMNVPIKERIAAIPNRFQHLGEISLLNGTYINDKRILSSTKERVKRAT